MLAAVPGLNFDVVSCVNRRSLAELDAIKELLIAAGVKRWRLFTIFPAGRAAAYPEFNLTAGEIDSLMRFIVRIGVCASCHNWRYCEGNGMHLRNADGSLMHCIAKTGKKED